MKVMEKPPTITEILEDNKFSNNSMRITFYASNPLWVTSLSKFLDLKLCKNNSI
jgi:hypothetical protein